MKTLYESILDDDDKIKDRIDNNLLPSVIVDKLKQYFNKYLERTSNIKRVGQWYPLGEVDDDLYDKESIKNTEKFMINAIKHMHLDIKRAVPHTLISIDPDWKEKFGETYIKRYTVVLKNSGEEYVFEFTIHAKQYTVAKLEQIEHIAIWTKNEKIAEMI